MILITVVVKALVLMVSGLLRVKAVVKVLGSTLSEEPARDVDIGLLVCKPPNEKSTL